MAHDYKVREIAVQAGLSKATVDRVLHARAGVRPGTVRQVEQAIADLDRQRTQLRLGGRTFMVDVVVHAPQRFSSALRAALEAELPSLAPAVVRSRFSLRESWPVAELVATLDRIGRRGSHGVVLKAPDVPEVTAAVQRLGRAGVPVVTLVTDLPGSGRLAYVGMDNRAAGATAAYLIRQWLHDRRGNVLVTVSSSAFRGEEEREMGFRAAMRTAQPSRALVEVTGSEGLNDAQRDLVLTALARDPDLTAVYSIGGANIATVDAFDAVGRRCAVFVAHDLDEDNLRLLHAGRLSAVLHHDLGRDLREACRLIMQAHGALPHRPAPWPSTIQIVTPFNVPAPPD